MNIQPALSACDDAQWDAFAREHPASTVYHLSAWRRAAIRNYGAVDRSLVCLDGTRICGIVPLLSVRRFPGGKYLTSGVFGSYGGILAGSDNIASLLAQAAVRTARDDSAGFIVLKEYSRVEHPGFTADHGYVTFVLDLTGGPDAAWKQLQCNTRNHVRKAQKAGLTCSCGPEGLAEFLRIYSINIRDLGTPYPGSGFFTDLAADLMGLIAFILVRHASKVIGAGLLLRYKDTVYVPFSATLKEYRSYCPGNILFWHAIEYAAGLGCRFFDFGRSSSGSGTAQFKKQWGAVERQLYYQFSVCRGSSYSSFNPNETQYRLCSSLWKMLPVWAANRLGPRIIRYIL